MLYNKVCKLLAWIGYRCVLQRHNVDVSPDGQQLYGLLCERHWPTRLVEWQALLTAGTRRTGTGGETDAQIEQMRVV